MARNAQVDISEVIFSKCERHGISEFDFLNTHDRYERYVNEQYPQPRYSEEWREWKVQLKVWENFFPQQRFPYPAPQINNASESKERHSLPNSDPPRLFQFNDGSKSPGTSANAIQLRMQQAIRAPFAMRAMRAPLAMRAPPLKATALPAKALPATVLPATALPAAALPVTTSNNRLYRTLEGIMQEKALNKGGSELRRRFFQYLQKMRDFAKKEHGSCSSDYRAYLADLMTWNQFFKYDVFPGKEPTGQGVHKCNAYRKSSAAPLPSATATTSVPTKILNNDPACQVDAGRNSHHMLLNGKAITFTRQILQGICDSFSKDIKERPAVEKAIGCQFSLIIPNQNYMVRGLVVTPLNYVTNMEDRAVVINRGYSFLDAWVDKAYTSLANDGMRRLSISEYFQQWKEFKKPDKTPDLDDVDISRHRSGTAPCGILIQGAYQKKLSCSESQLKDLSYIFLVDDKTGVEEAIQCKLIIQGNGQDDWSTLSVALQPVVDNLHPAIYKVATDLFLDWVENSLKKPIKLSTFWKTWSEQNLNSGGGRADTLEPTEEAAASSVDSGYVDPGTDSLISLADPEAEWEKYADTFKTDDFDRIYIEEQAKAEGGLRIVVDKETGDLVTLDEFELRTRLRERASHGSIKRKAGSDGMMGGEDDDNHHVQKRICL